MAKNMNKERVDKGIYRRFSKRLNGPVYYIEYSWFPSGLDGLAKPACERVPADKDGRCRLKAARRLRARRLKDRYLTDWRPPATLYRGPRHKDNADAGRSLVFEDVVDQFLTHVARSIRKHKQPDAVRRGYERLGRVFDGCRLDEIRRKDVIAYYHDRRNRTGEFKGWKYQVGPRPAMMEVGALSRLYSFLEDVEGVDGLVNPCRRIGRALGDRGAGGGAYRPSHRTPSVSDAALVALLTAERKARTGGRRLGRNGPRTGRDLITPTDRAFWLLTYYLAARPESEPARLTHADVQFLPDGWARVTFRDTKTRDDRTVPLHPEAVLALRAVLAPEPSRFDKRAWEDWRRTPIFRKEGMRPEPWDRDSYKKAWRNTLAVVAAAYPDDNLEGLWLRDLRKVAKTRMVRARVHPNVINAFLGHRPRAAEEVYFVPEFDDLKPAAEALSLGRVFGAESGNSSGNSAARTAEG